MQRLDDHRYRCGYPDEISLYFDQIATGLEMAAPVSLGMLLLLGRDDFGVAVEMALFFAASASLYSAYARSQTHYAVKKIDELDCVLEKEARHHPFATSKVCLFSSVEDVDRGHRKTRISAGLATAVVTVLSVLDVSKLSSSQQAIISVMVYLSMIAAYEVFTNVKENCFGAQVVEVEHARYEYRR